MKIFVFDIDNTLILHTNKNTDFYQKSDSKISTLISDIKVDNVYIYTNGTYGHGEKVHKSLNIPKTKKIFGRDTLPYMKPHIQSFHFVNGEIISENTEFVKIKELAYNYNITDQDINRIFHEESLKIRGNM